MISFYPVTPRAMDIEALRLSVERLIALTPPVAPAAMHIEAVRASPE